MDQHPIPQNVTSYQFRLVGDMTLKQFSELAGGIILAFLFSKTTIIPFFIKWPLAGLFAFGGIALAFLPIEERPLDQWLINFIKAVYSPTQYLWCKQNKIPEFFTFKKRAGAQKTLSAGEPKDKKQLQAFMQTLQVAKTPLSSIDKYEKRALELINNLFGPSSVSNIALSSSTSFNQPAGLKQRKLKPKKEVVKKEIIFKVKKENVGKNPPKPLVKIEPAPPLAPPLKVTSLYPPKPPKKRKPGGRKKRVEPQFANDLPMPIPPDLPNLLIGMVVGPDDRLVPNAILEIKNSQGNPVRALKTNKLGQFFIATSLADGHYEIEVDHPSYQFDIIKIQATGKIVPPIKIKAVKEIKLEEKEKEN